MVSVSTTMNLLSPLSLLLISVLLSYTGSAILCNGRVIKDDLAGFQKIDLPGVIGPESLAFDCHGEGPYASVSDGRILKWNATSKAWKEFAVTSPNRDRKACDGSTDPNKETCGRPLGIKFDSKTCNLYIADAYFGLHVVGPSGGVAEELATSADDGVPFNFLNGLDVDAQTGVVYFSDSSTLYKFRDWPKILGGKDKTGRR
ncbi:hypothetical protein L6164_001832 [Bauhinia variegata]|uniref:Uncharacterized protein n=1 Tax=Bauhinia variegata TaxID=167791 RepID=A0ACB9QE36_BAUVA|nr:hypothetical protein L6164_001832 [Bauhinia variegata]